MKEKEPAGNGRERDENGSRDEGSRERKFNRDDSAGHREEAYKSFTKDKRPRARIASEKVEYRPKTDHSDREHFDRPHSGDEQERRRSYNPNFTPDNRPAFEKREYQPRDNNRYDNRQHSERREYGEGGYDRKPSYDRGEGNRNYGDRPRYNEQKPYGERKQYGERQPYGERKPYGDRSYGDKPYGDRPRTDKPYGERPYGDRQHSDKPYGNRQHSDKPYGERSYGDRQHTDKPYGERRQYGDRPSYQNRERSYGGDGQRKEWQGERKQHGSSAYGDSGQPRTGGYRPQENRGGYGNHPRGEGGERGGYRQQGDRREGGRPYSKGNRDGGRKPYGSEYDSTNYPTFPVEQTGESIRLNRYIAMSGICSRREADEHIQAGKVTVNGVAATELGAKVLPTDEVRFDGEVLQNEKKVYIVMNKPKGYVTSVEDPHADKTVMDLLKNSCKERVYPVGRLDKNSLGVLLVTNDGDLAKQLTHPEYQKKKIYQVTLDQPLTRSDMNMLAEGVELEDGEIHADAISYVGTSKNEVGIEIHSGRNRIVRRMFEHLGYRVMKLDRVYFAGLTKQKLKRGQWRFLTPREVQALRSGRYE